MSDGNDTERWLADLGLSIHELLRYGYGGLLVFLVGGLVDPQGTRTVVQTLTSPLSIVVALALGCAIYAAYRPIAELLFWGLEGIHSRLSDGGKRDAGFTCCSDYFKTKWNVQLRLGREAFRVVRASNEFKERQKQFYLQHSELHTVFITAFILFIASASVGIIQHPGALVSAWTLFGVAVIALICGSVGDCLLCRQECKTMLMMMDPEAIEAILRRTGFIKPRVDARATAEQDESSDRSGPTLGEIRG